MRMAWRVKALRYATVLAIVPGHRAQVFVALAAIGLIPEKSSAGNEMKLPPPAKEFKTPARSAATNRKMARPKGTRKSTVIPGENAGLFLVSSTGFDKRNSFKGRKCKSRSLSPVPDGNCRDRVRDDRA